MERRFSSRDLGQGSGADGYCKVWGFQVACVSGLNSDCSKVLLRGAETWSSHSLQEPSPPGPACFLPTVCPCPTPAQPRGSHPSLNLLLQWFESYCPGRCIKFQCILHSVKIYIIVGSFFFFFFVYCCIYLNFQK